MPLIFNITTQDILRGKTIDPGWYKLEVKSVTQDAARTDGSMLAVVDFEVLEGPFAKTPVRRWFSEKAAGFAVPFLRACGATIGDEGASIDFDRCKGKKILGYIINEMYEGKPTNKVEDFKPLVAGATVAGTPVA